MKKWLKLHRWTQIAFRGSNYSIRTGGISPLPRAGGGPSRAARTFLQRCVRPRPLGEDVHSKIKLDQAIYRLLRCFLKLLNDKPLSGRDSESILWSVTEHVNAMAEREVITENYWKRCPFLIPKTSLGKIGGLDRRAAEGEYSDYRLSYRRRRLERAN
jgi:hypothetical protein